MTISIAAGRRLLAAAGTVVAASLIAANAMAAGPYLGAPVNLPGTIQAENFDKGGERISYHDTTAANTGGRYRLKEGVDITSASGGYAINNFEAGEWLVYTFAVATRGYYDIDLLASSKYSTGAYHLEIDAKPATDVVGVANTSDWNVYKWSAKRRVFLEAGTHSMTVAADQQYFNLDAIRVALATVSSAPYSGTPSPVPGIIEAESYDRGGEGVAYHDTTTGNAGGVVRTEDVDLMAMTAPNSGYIIGNFEAGEWLAYTVNVATTGDYDLEARVGSGFDNSAYHIEIDGAPVTSRIVVPNAGNWDTYQWLGKKRVTLAAGQHLVKVVSETPYFGLDAIRFTAATAVAAQLPATSSAKLLFRSGFEGATNIVPWTAEDIWGTGGFQGITGLDSTTGFSWPTNIWNGWGGGGKILSLTDPVAVTPATIDSYLFNRLDSVTGHTGASSRTLYQEITRGQNGTESMGASVTQTQFQFLPGAEVPDMYISYWIKLQPDLVEKMTNLPAGPGISEGGTWRSVFGAKTGTQNTWGGPADNGDYRIAAYIVTYGNTRPYWRVSGDNVAGGNAPLVNNWDVYNKDVPVPVGQWFKFELYWHRSAGSDGRVWAAVNGQTIADHRGPNMGAQNLPINRIMAPILYSHMRMPMYQWVDDIEVWDGIPNP
jgi:hypothetical protein